jgi:hypothetical protein
MVGGTSPTDFALLAVVIYSIPRRYVLDILLFQPQQVSEVGRQWDGGGVQKVV